MTSKEQEALNRIKQLEEENQKLRDERNRKSWENSPDRMGGQFSREELDPHYHDMGR